MNGCMKQSSIYYIYRQEYSQKDELGMLDYDDLQILVLKLLEDESIRRNTRIDINT